jgi:hypothetical protein
MACWLAGPSESEPPASPCGSANRKNWNRPAELRVTHGRVHLPGFDGKEFRGCRFRALEPVVVVSKFGGLIFIRH